MKVNEQRKQMYLNGEVGMIFDDGTSEQLHMIDPKGAMYLPYDHHSDSMPDTFHPISWFFEQDEPQTNRTPTHVTNGYQKLFDYMQDEHGVTLLVTDMDEIIRIVHGMHPTKPEPSRLEVAAMIAATLSITGRTAEYLARTGLSIADELIKQSKQTP